jgi:hypothetical protein
MKICNRCNNYFPATTGFFNKNSKLNDGLHTICKQCIKIYNSNRYKNNKTKMLLQSKKWVKNNQNKVKKNRRLWYEKNKKEILQKALQYKKHRYKTDLSYKLLCSLRRRLHRTVDGKSKNNSTIKLLGCSIEELKIHLEKQFTNGMSWKNYGKWHIDHIKPCASFDLSLENEQKLCFHFTNLQPLWAKDNIKKSDKII